MNASEPIRTDRFDEVPIKLRPYCDELYQKGVMPLVKTSDGQYAWIYEKDMTMSEQPALVKISRLERTCDEYSIEMQKGFRGYEKALAGVPKDKKTLFILLKHDGENNIKLSEFKLGSWYNLFNFFGKYEHHLSKQAVRQFK